MLGLFEEQRRSQCVRSKASAGENGMPTSVSQVKEKEPAKDTERRTTEVGGNQERVAS